MSKIAEHYLEVDPWVIAEKGLHRERARVSESIFAVSNEFMGVRGYFEEGYSGERMQGAYFNGVFEEEAVPPTEFKGIVKRTHFMVNACDWLHTRIRLDGETLDLARSRFRDFERRLDMREGILRRSFIWRTRAGKELRLRFARFTSMSRAHLAYQRIEAEPLNFSGLVEITMGIDFDTRHNEFDRGNLWPAVRAGAAGGTLAVLGQTGKSRHRVFAAMRLQGDRIRDARVVKAGKFIGRSFALPLRAGEVATVDRLASFVTEKDPSIPDAAVWKRGVEQAGAFAATETFDRAAAAHRAYWDRQWKDLDVRIEGDPAAQQGLRFCIFNLHQAYHGVDPANNITAKGLTSEFYWGVTWWDTETYCLPFYLFNNPRAAKNLLAYRYRTLPQACERARQKDCRGARYPMCTIDGTEACYTWQHGDLEIHVSAAVAYGVWHYTQVTGDTAFLFAQGIEMLLQICRYYASRGAWSQRTQGFGFWFVMGPDEFHMGVNNNCYTNMMAQRIFRFTLATLARMRRESPARLRALERRVGLQPGEPREWKRMADRMIIRLDSRIGVYEQHDGFFDSPHLDCSKIPPADFPLYRNWAYFRIFRWDMLKQPDVLLLQFFFSHAFTPASKKANFDFYEPRCSHESSLSPGIHSILAAELGYHDKAYRYWEHAARLDLDDYNRNTSHGLHTTSMAAAWLNVVYGFGGMRSDGPVLSFNPSLPARWTSFRFRLKHRGSTLEVGITRDAATFSVVAGGPLAIEVFGRRRKAGRNGIRVPMPRARLGRKEP